MNLMLMVASALQPYLVETAEGVAALSAGRRSAVITISLLIFVALVCFAIRQLYGPLRNRFQRPRRPRFGQFP